MKKTLIATLLLLSLLLFSSCGTAPQGGKEEETGEDLTALSAAELYEYACERANLEAVSFWETRVTEPDGETVEVTTLRCRNGYDGFSYSRKGGGDKILFLDGTAYLSTAVGNWSSPLSTRQFQDFLEENTFPTGLLTRLVETAEKTEDGVTYTLKDTALASFALLSDGGDFVPQKASGSAVIDENGTVLSEEITVTGLLGGKAVAYKLETKAAATQEQVTLPEGEKFASVGDVRVPLRITEGAKRLGSSFPLNVTLLVTSSVTAGETKLSQYEETVVEALSDGEYYVRCQNLKQVGAEQSESRYVQTLVTPKAALFGEYDLKEGTWLSQGEAEKKEGYLLELLVSALPELSQMTEITLTEEVLQDTVSFTLTKEAAEALYGNFKGGFPEATLPAALSQVEANGVFTFSKKGEIVAFSLSLKGDAQGSAFYHQVSLTPRQGSDIRLPEELVLPTYIDPNHGGADQQ